MLNVFLSLFVSLYGYSDRFIHFFCGGPAISVHRSVTKQHKNVYFNEFSLCFYLQWDDVICESVKRVKI